MCSEFKVRGFDGERLTYLSMPDAIACEGILPPLSAVICKLESIELFSGSTSTVSSRAVSGK